MLKRMKLPIIALSLAALMLCGWTAYAATGSNTATSTTLTGKLVTQTADTLTIHTEAGDQSVPLASSVWVYLNEQKAQLSALKTGDSLEVILNNKKQAAYVKGTSAASAAGQAEQPQPVQPSETPAQEVPSATASPAPSPSSSPTKLKDDAPASAPNTPGKRADDDEDENEDMDFSVDGQHFNLHIKQSTGPRGVQFELLCQSPHVGNIHLTGAQAEAWISKILGSVDLKAANAQQLLRQQLAKQYDLDADKLNVHWKTKPENKHESKDDSKNEDKQREDKQHEDKHESKNESKRDDKNENRDKRH